MSELTDLNAQGMGLGAVAGGLQGLLEAYKMKMAQQAQQAEITQSGLNAGAAARAQAEMMAPYRAQMADVAASNAAATTSNAQVERFKAGMSTDSNGQSPRGLAVQQVLAGSAPPTILDMKDPATLLAWNAQANGKSYNDLVAAQSQKDFQNKSSTISDQNNAKSMLDSLATMKSLVPGLGLSDSPGVGQQLAYLKNSVSSKIGGTAAQKYLAMSGPQQMQLAEFNAHRFSMPEMDVTAPALGFNNTGPSLNSNIDLMSSKLAKAAGLEGYKPNILSFDKNGNLMPSGSAAPSPAPSAAPAPGATPAPAAPVAPAAASLMNAGGADLGGPPGGGANAPVGGASPGKYANLTMDQLQALKLTQMGQPSAVGQ